VGEPEVLIALVSSVLPKNVLEFGVNVGRTAQMLLEYCPTIERYEGVDVPMGYVTEKAVQRKEVPEIAGELVLDDPRFKLILRPTGSHELTAQDLSPCDAVFIDGDHSRKGVMNDSALAFELIRPGGIVIWHDYHDLDSVDVRDVLHDMQKEIRRTIAARTGIVDRFLSRLVRETPAVITSLHFRSR
jgi:predicted O-methyltransferase YrrM